MLRQQRSILDYFSSKAVKPVTSVAVPPQPVEAISQEIVAFTDGSFMKKGKLQKVGWAVVFPHNSQHDRSGKLNGNFETINRAEYIAFIEAIKASNEIDPTETLPLVVHSDSELLVKTVNLWMRTWKRAGWIKYDKKPVKNLDLLIDIDNMMHQRRRIQIFHVRAHQKTDSFYSRWNNEADRMAKQAANRE
jgi:ribonuclease HI